MSVPKFFKTSILISLIATTTLLFAIGNTFSDYSKQILSIEAKPKKHIQVSSIFIIHPLVKHKEIKLLYVSTLTWNGNNCIRKVVQFKKLKGGKLRGTRGVGKTFKHSYIPKDLKTLCTNALIISWKNVQSLKLDNRRFNGFKFIAVLNGEKRESIIYLNSDGLIHALSFGFPKEGISHSKNMKDKGTIWYFKKMNGSLKLVKIIAITAQKKRGIPIIKKIVNSYSNF